MGVDILEVNAMSILDGGYFVPTTVSDTGRGKFVVLHHHSEDIPS